MGWGLQLGALENNTKIMEKFDHENYRDSLAEDLKNVSSHAERKDALHKEKEGFRYGEAREKHLEEVEVYKTLTEEAERKSELVAKSFWNGILGEDFGVRFIKQGACSCSLARQVDDEANIVENYEKAKKEKPDRWTQEEYETKLAQALDFNRKHKKFQDKVLEEHLKEIKGGVGFGKEEYRLKFIGELISKKIGENYEKLSYLLGNNLDDSYFANNVKQIVEDKDLSQTCISYSGSVDPIYKALVKKALDEEKQLKKPLV